MYLFFLSFWRVFLLCVHALAAPFERGRRPLAGVLLILGLPLFFVWLALQLLGFMLDEVFFRAYRRIEIKRPIFVIGPPRTGTTHLHHVLAVDPQTTTFRTWECLFGLSVTMRYLCRGLATLHRALGSPFGKVAALLGRKLTGGLDDIHPVRLDDPEEDFLSFLPIMACFLLLVPFPKARWLYRVARCDSELDARERDALMRFYRRAVQRHLYVNGSDKTFLSKNASFCGTINSLLREFPDARVIATVRDPAQVVPSQLSSLKPGFAACGFASIPEDFRTRMIPLLAHYYLNMADAADSNPGRVAFIENGELRHRLEASVLRALAELGIEPGDALVERLASSNARESTNASRHQYTLDEFGLNETSIQSRFAAVYARFSFDTGIGIADRDSK